jgi:gluconolactonase
MMTRTSTDLARNPLDGWQLERSAIRTVGHDLQRPECILAERNGTLWSADARGGVMRIRPDGTSLKARCPMALHLTATATS